MPMPADKKPPSWKRIVLRAMLGLLLLFVVLAGGLFIYAKYFFDLGGTTHDTYHLSAPA